MNLKPKFERRKAMNKFLLLITCTLIFVGLAHAQVFVDFETEALGTDGFADNGWGTGLTAVERIADPTGVSDGVLSLGCNASGSGVIQKDNVSTNNAEVISFKIYLPADFPDSASVTFWSQDNATWSGFPSSTYYGIDLPKETWVALNFDLLELDISEAEVFEPYPPNKMGKLGIQIVFYDAAFTGDILVDDVTYIGVEPSIISDFEVEALGTDNFVIGWGDASIGVERVADPSGNSDGVLAVSADGSLGDKKVAVQREGVAPDGAHVFTFNLWLPADFPDDVYLQVFGQDNDGWEWSANGYNSADIPKETWYPMNYDIMTAFMKDPSLDPYSANTFGKVGMEALFGETAWSGTFYIDDARMLGTKVGARWVIADFEIEALGQQSWDSGWGDAKVSSARVEDPTGRGGYVLEMVCDGTQGDRKAAFANEQIPVIVGEDTANALKLDLYLPAEVPGGSWVQIFGQDRKTWGWQSDGQNASSLKLGAWNTLTFDIAKRIAEEPTYDVSDGIKAGVEILFEEGNSFQGSVYVDNITLMGVNEIIGPLESPTLTNVAHETDQDAQGITISYNTIEWLDLNRTGETYNVYASETGPITDVSAAGVIQLAAGLAEDLGVWYHRVYTADGAEKTYYYAVTCTGLNENQEVVETPVKDGISNAGPITGPTTVAQHIPLVDEFDFEIDGDIDEFQELAEIFTASKLIPQRVSGGDVGALVTDDFPEFGEQAWQGDGFDIYMGFYDVSAETIMHGKTALSDGVGDYRISYAINNTESRFQRNGYESWELEGVDHDVDIMDECYVVEISIPLASLDEGPAFTPANGMFLPLMIHVNDNDGPDDPFGEGKSLVNLWGNIPGNAEDWLRPDAWGWILLTNDPTTSVAKAPLAQPKETKLYANYPNPFNPTTKISYYLANDNYIKLVVYDVMGREIRTLVNKTQKMGHHSIDWNGKDNTGTLVSSGMYFIKMVSNDYQRVHKMMLIK
jgi:hypothetical protein